jgi:hypothetical protein
VISGLRALATATTLDHRLDRRHREEPTAFLFRPPGEDDLSEGFKAVFELKILRALRAPCAGRGMTLPQVGMVTTALVGSPPAIPFSGGGVSRPCGDADGLVLNMP